jgi:type VI protein secretion system component VasK
MPSVSATQLLKTASLLILVLAFEELSGCNLCKDEVLEKAASPDGKWVATIMTRDCGATTSEYIAVNLQDAKQKRLDEENNVFVVKHLHPLHVFWQGNDSLAVDCGNCNLDEAAKKLEKLGSVKVIYR